jgi:hypothetical protein
LEEQMFAFADDVEKMVVEDEVDEESWKKKT